VTSTPWARVAPIVEAALLHDEQARAAFVAEACGTDMDLVREVESLLAHASADTDFLSTPALAMAQLDETPTDASRLAPGQRVGVYRIERLLGRGGMGEVYEAEHLEHGRRIALNVEPAIERCHRSRAIPAGRPARRRRESPTRRLHLWQ